MEAMPYEFLNICCESLHYLATEVCPQLVLLITDGIWGKGGLREPYKEEVQYKNPLS